MIYYVEDDDNIRGLTLYALRQQGIEAEGFSCDSEFKAAVARRVPDAVASSTSCFPIPTVSVVHRAPMTTATVPIMMLTAKDSELDKVIALDGGAEMTTQPKPYPHGAPSRCRALLRRGGVMSRPAPRC